MNQPIPHTAASSPAPAARLALASVLLVVALATPGATQAPTTEWTSYTSMRQVNDLLRYNGEVWVCTSGGVLRYNEQSRAYTRYTRLDGLAGNRVLSVAVDANGHLWFGTDGLGLSRYRPEAHTFDPPFIEFRNRRIAALLAYGTRLFVGTDHGVSVFLIEREEVKETYRKLGGLSKDTPVTAMALASGVLYAGTSDGAAWADLSQPNLQDPDSWRSSSTGSVTGLVSAAGEIVLSSDRGGLSYDAQLRRFVYDYTDEPATASGIIGGRPIVATASGNFYRRDGFEQWTRIPGPIYANATALSKRGDDLWIGTANGVRVIGGTAPPASREPAANRFYEMELFSSGELWVTSAPSDHQEDFGVSRLTATGWTVYDQSSGLPRSHLVALEQDAAGRLWLGTWGGGAAVRTSERSWAVLGSDSSPLRGVPKAPQFIAVSDVQRDGDGNMWMLNVTAGLAVMDGYPADQSYLIDQTDLGLGPDVDFYRLAIGADGIKWISSRTHGLVIVDDGGTPFAGGDDAALAVTTGTDSRLSSNRSYDVLVTPDQVIWLATDAGLNAIGARYDRATGMLDVDDWRVYTTLDGLPTNEINAIELDGAGNLWVATEGGLSQIGSDGEVAFTLTESNSGLSSSRVTSLLFDPAAGELWIGTFSGLNRLVLQQGESGGPSGLVVYPNPFDNTGEAPLTFAGLPLGASLRIFAADGSPVARVAGVPGLGTLTWRGQNEAGFLVASGVYLFAAEDADGHSVRGRFAVVAGGGAP